MYRHQKNYLYPKLIYLLITLVLVIYFFKVPDSLNWSVATFLCIMAVFDRINLKVFSGFGYSFHTVILGLIIFDSFSLVYGLIYIFADFFVSLILNRKRKGAWSNEFVMVLIFIMTVIISNHYYNDFTNGDFLSRYSTLLLILILTFSLRYIYIFLETRKLTTKMFLDFFALMVFEILLIFPIVAFFDDLNVNFVLLLFLSYYCFIGFLHKKFMSVDDWQIEYLTKSLEEKHGVKFIFKDLGEVKGICYISKKMIFIDEKLDYPEQLQTIIHELVHFTVRDRLTTYKPTEELIVTLFEAIISWYYIITLRNHK
ncbi:MAG: ImmA/IrrE family metallo-endopeptidase [Bacillaceae bacterium]|nr:ImmA/IrrE family metallo-endopeptidase [Bacillaceae bacterium]